jgi:DNA-binding NtrC family response regulator
LEEAVTGERRALVVDDDPGIRVLVTRILTRNGFVVETARDGGEAIEKVLQHDYKVITLDLMMPRIDGFAVVKYLTEHRPDLLANVIVVTAFGPNAFEKVCPPVVRFIEKPFDLNALLAEATACADDEPNEADGAS